MSSNETLNLIDNSDHEQTNIHYQVRVKGISTVDGSEILLVMGPSGGRGGYGPSWVPARFSWGSRPYGHDHFSTAEKARDYATVMMAKSGEGWVIPEGTPLQIIKHVERTISQSETFEVT